MLVKLFKILLLCFFFYNCDHSKKKIDVANKKNDFVAFNEKSLTVFGLDSNKLGVNFQKRGNYNLIKSELVRDNKVFKKLFKINEEKAIDSASTYIYNKLINEIVPHWYETTWDFNGHTNIPN